MSDIIYKLFFVIFVFWYSPVNWAAEFGSSPAEKIEPSLIDDPSVLELINELRSQIRSKKLSRPELDRLQAYFQQPILVEKLPARKAADVELTPVRKHLLESKLVDHSYGGISLVERVIDLVHERRLSREAIADIRVDLGLHKLVLRSRLEPFMPFIALMEEKAVIEPPPEDNPCDECDDKCYFSFSVLCCVVCGCFSLTGDGSGGIW